MNIQKLIKMFAKNFCIIAFFFNIISLQAQTYNFTTCGAVGKNGPTQSQVNSTYTGGNLLTGNVTISTQGIQQWTVPATALYRITASGGEGGISTFTTPAAGKGRVISTEVTLTAGQVINIVVGQAGQQSASSSIFSAGGSGGGGSFVYTGAIGGAGLIAAAAGGGGGLASGTNIQAGNVSDGNFGTSGSNIAGFNNAYVALGGTGGNGGGFSNRGVLSGGPGAGWLSGYNTAFQGTFPAVGGTRFIGGTLSSGGKEGGFGGGGASGDNDNNGYVWAGGGGGYSGGAAGHNVGNSDGQIGGGGGSYLVGSNQTNVGLNSGNGYVTIINLIPAATALNFDGVDDYVAINSPFRAFNKEITVEFWMNPASANLPFGSVMGQGTSGVDNMANNVWLMHPNADGTMTFYVNDAGTWRSVTCNVTAGSWHHYAGVASATSTKIYVDGVLMATGPGVSNTILNNAGSVIHLGKDVRLNSGRFANISLDEVRVWSRALCQAEIVNNKNCEKNAQSSLQEVYHFNQGNVNVNNSGVTTLTDASGNARDGSLNNFALAGLSSNWVASGSTNSGTCAAFVAPSAPVTGNASIVLGGTSQLANTIAGGTWSSNAISIASVNASGLVTGVSNGSAIISYITDCGSLSMFTVTVSPPATALKFDPSLPAGDNSRLNYVNIASPYNAFQKEITVEFWMNPATSLLPFGSVMGQGNANSGDNNSGGEVWLMHPNADGTMTFFVNDGGTFRATNCTIIANSWHHYAGVASATSTKFYVDGVLVHTGPGISGTIPVNPSSVIHIGKDVRFATRFITNNDPQNRYATMIMDEVRVWSRALCQGEIVNNINKEINPAGQNGLQEYYRFNTGLAGGDNTGVTTLSDLSGNGRNGTLLNFTLNGANSNWVISGSTNTGIASAFVAPNAPITGTNAICIGGNTTLANVNTGGLWTSGNTAVATINPSSGVVSGLTAGSSTITYTNVCGGVSTTIITVNALPTIASVTGATTICSGTATTLTATSVASSPVFNWYTVASGGIPVFTGAVFTTLNLVANTTFYVDVTYASGCISAARTAVPITITTINNQTVTASPTVFCGSGSSTISVGSTQTGVNYTLRNNAGNSIIAGPIAGTGSAINFNTGTINATTTYNVFAQSGPTGALNFNGSTNVSVPHAAALNVGGGGQLTMEAWVNPAVSNSWRNIMMKGAYGYGMAIDASNRLYFWDQGLGNANDTWSNVTVPANTWSHVAITVQDNGSTLAVTLYLNGVNVGNKTSPIAQINDNSNNLIIGMQGTGCPCNYFNGKLDDLRIWNTVRTSAQILASMNSCLAGSETGLIALYKMDDGIGTTVLDSRSGNNGIVNGTATWTSGNVICGAVCSLQMSSTPTVTVNPLPNVTANHAGAGCENDQIELYSSPGVSHSWTGPNGFTSNQQNPIIINGILANAGIYTVTVTDANGCSASASTTVTVNALPVITAGSNSPACVGGTLNLTSNGGVSYIWTGPNGFNNNTQNPSLTNIVLAAAGTYFVKGTGANGCRNDASVVVTLNPAPVATVSSNSPLCSGTGITLTLSAGGGTSYSWTGPNGFTSNLQNPTIADVTALATGAYTVTVNNPGCAGSNASVSVTVSQTPSIPVVSAPAIICAGSSTSLTATTSAGSIVWWNAPTGGSIVGTGSPLVVTPGSTTTYYAEGFAAGGAGVVVNSLSTIANGAVEINAQTGDDRGGIAVTQTAVYINGDNGVGRFDHNLAVQASLLPQRDGIFCDINPSTAGQLWTLWNTVTNTSPGGINNCATCNGTVNAIVQMDQNMALGATVMLSTPISLTTTPTGTCCSPTGPGIFSGSGYVLLFSSTSNSWYSVNLVSGNVLSLGTAGGGGLNAMGTENWARWGWAEFNGTDYFAVYRDNSGQSIVKKNISTGVVTTIQGFSSLSDMANIVYSPWDNRAYMHHEGTAQFRSGDESLENVNGTSTTGGGISCSSTARTGVTITVNPLPTITCPANMVVNVTAGQCGANVSFASTATGIPTPTITYSIASGSFFNVGTTTVTATATNSCGTVSCSFTVQVIDNITPTITCPSNISVNATGASGAVVTYTTPVGTDNCPGSVTTLIGGLASGTTFPIGVTTVTYRVTDAAGLTATCSFTVTVAGLAPVIVCPTNITVNNTPGQCGANVSFAATETTGIPASTITYSIAPGSFFAVGTTTVTATATNAVGTVNCSFTVTVVDNQPPVLTIPADVTLECDANRLPTGPSNMVTYNNLQGNFDVYTENGFTTTLLNGSHYHAYNDYNLHSGYSARWTATAGNFKLTSINIEFGSFMLTASSGASVTTSGIGVFTLPNTAQWQNLSYVDFQEINESAVINVSFQVGSSNGGAQATDICDNNPIITYTDDNSGLTGCNGTGILRRTWTATDAAGNTTSLVQNITIQDTQAPVITNCVSNISVFVANNTCGALCVMGRSNCHR